MSYWPLHLHQPQQAVRVGDYTKKHWGKITVLYLLIRILVLITTFTAKCNLRGDLKRVRSFILLPEVTYELYWWWLDFEVSGHSSNPLTETENSGVGRCIKEPSLCKVTAIFTASGPPTLGSIRLNKGTVVTLIKQALEYVRECIAFAMMACSSLAQWKKITDKKIDIQSQFLAMLDR